MNSLCRPIEKNEELNYHHQEIISKPNTAKASLIVYPFTNCYPYDRRENLEKWNEIACKIFKYEQTRTIKIEDSSDLPSNALEYRVAWVADNNKFRVTAELSRELFRPDFALIAIKSAMEDVKKIVNEIIEIAWKHKKMIECFPEFNSTITEGLQKEVTRLNNDTNYLKNKVSDLDVELNGIWGRGGKIIEDGRERLSVTQRLKETEDSIGELKVKIARRRK